MDYSIYALHLQIIMATERQTPPPIPGKRPRNITLQIESVDEMEEVSNLVEQARTLVRQRLEANNMYLGETVLPHPEQIKLGAIIELIKIRQSEKPLDKKQMDEVMEAIIEEISMALIRTYQS